MRSTTGHAESLNSLILFRTWDGVALVSVGAWFDKIVAQGDVRLLLIVHTRMSTIHSATLKHSVRVRSNTPSYFSNFSLVEQRRCKSSPILNGAGQFHTECDAAPIHAQMGRIQCETSRMKQQILSGATDSVLESANFRVGVEAWAWKLQLSGM